MKIDILRTRIIWFSTKIGISKLVLKWLFLRISYQITVFEIVPLKQGLKQNKQSVASIIREGL
jgi:hypothetical protein